MKPKYQPLPINGGNGEVLSTSYKARRWQDRACNSGLMVLVLLLALSNFVTFVTLSPALPAKEMPQDVARIEPLPRSYHQIWWRTVYGSHNATRDSPWWEDISPAHGFIAIDRAEAARRQWPLSMYLPGDHSKGLYLLEAYHQLHCLKLLRRTFYEAVEGKPFTVEPGAHHNHCWEALRSHVMCHADNTPLYTFGDEMAGNGQRHQCRDWDALRDYATRHSACYMDINLPVPLIEHFKHCDDGHDGLVWPVQSVDY